MRLGIEHQASNTSRSNEEGSTSRDDSNSPLGEERNNVELSLLISVREVLVSGRHVVEFSSQVELDQTSIEVLASRVELHAVLDILFNGVLVVVVLGQQFLIGKAVSLSQHSHPDSEFLGLEHGSVRGHPFVGGGVRGSIVFDLNDIGSVSLIGTFTSVTSGVSVTSTPLEVDVVTNTSVQLGRSEVVFSGRISLDDVSSLSSDVDVEDSSSSLDSTRTRSNVIDVRSVLEGSSELRSIQSQLMGSTILSEDLIILDGGVLSVGSPVNESSIGSVSVGTKIGSRDVVSQSHGTVAVVLANALLVLLSGESNVDSVQVSLRTRSQMILSGPGSLNAERRRNLPGLLFEPLSSFRSAFDGVILSFGNLSLGHLAISLGLDVLRFLSVEFAEILIVSEDGNVSPWRWMPVGIVISLLGTFVTVSVSVVVLSGIDGRSSSSVEVSFFLSVSNKETHVSFSVLAVLVVLVGLVHSVEEISVSINGNWSVGIVGDSISGGTITNSDHGIGILVGADVLENHVAVHLRIDTASVLNSPFDRHLRSFIEGHRGTNTISSLSIVLGVEQSVSIVSVCVCFVQSIIGASWAVHVEISVNAGN